MQNRLKALLQDKPIGVLFIIGVLTLLTIFKLKNGDNWLYSTICPLFNNVRTCVKNYHLPFWEVLTSFGTILAGLFAYLAIYQQNKQLHTNQIPIIVTPFALGVDKNTISIKNIGRGVALKIFVTSDYKGKHSVQKTSTPDLSYAVPTNSSQQDAVIELDSDKVSKTLINDIIILFVHYSDSEGNLYKTKAIYRKQKRKGIIENYLYKDNEVYQEKPIRTRLL